MPNPAIISYEVLA
jgi:hypothetical protein